MFYFIIFLKGQNHTQIVSPGGKNLFHPMCYNVNKCENGSENGSSSTLYLRILEGKKELAFSNIFNHDKNNQH